jgi:hypothetical protein
VLLLLLLGVATALMEQLLNPALGRGLLGIISLILGKKNQRRISLKHKDRDLLP